MKNTYNITTPTTVEGFRENLKKYFVCIGGNKEELYTQMSSHKISELNSLSDLYNYPIEGGNPKISLKVNLINDFKEYMLETNQFTSMNGYFENEDNFEIIENQNDFMSNYNPIWIGINNKLYRSFLYMTLGEFSGYSLVESELL